MPLVRVLIAVIVINGALNGLLLNFVVDHRAVPAVTALWMAFGYARVFARRLVADSFKNAFRGVLKALLWPAIPRAH